ncbi:MAG: heme biosynthesis HemY N-terminal domain-containing protein [Pseudomonadota bacterium]|uniref:heme biosynthesis HemY N-terminal domain-containing protein n=1 Tax=Gallaecimonas pentaromativorans TaxID=584787 RepID=UPI00067F610C|nr:heme biosynthesis HemY N-terminal domain-containing protein [Gallaecimonas pentaromativorans]MED5526216.1 heme biosynthesis HemY N-terminal domain-containing protein [Pseudomonadota bacterium]
MIRLLILLAILIAGLIAGPLLMNKTGYVLIALGDYTIETTGVVLATLILVLMGLIWCLDWLVRRIARSFGSSKSWFSDRSGRRAQKKASKAWEQLWQGHYGQAGAALAAAVPHAPLPDFPRLAAAYAEHRAGDKDERDRQLKALDQPLAGPAMLLHLGDIEAARKAFDELPAELKDAKSGNALAARLALAEGDMAGLWANIDALSDSDRDKYYQQAFQARLRVASQEGSASLSRLEQVLDKHSRQRPEVLASLALAHGALGEKAKGLDLVMPGIKKDPQPQLLATLPVLTDHESAASTQRQLLKWHHGRDRDPALLACLGGLSQVQGDLREARRYLEAALQLKDEGAWRQRLAEVLTKQGDFQGAVEQYRRLV